MFGVPIDGPARLLQKSRYFNRFLIIFAKSLAKSETFVLRPRYFCRTFTSNI